MIANLTYSSNGVQITDPTSQPGWRGQLAPYTHCLQWVDAHGCSHSLTLRADTLEALLADLKLVKQGIRITKQKATEHRDPQVPAVETPDVMRCEIHGVDMPRRWSKRTSGSYFAHKLPNDNFCYGKARP